jgi:hypothetical protein
MRIHIGFEFLEDGVFVTRLLVFMILTWPLLATMLVYTIRRSSISRKKAFLLSTTLAGYSLSLLGPLAMLGFFMLLGTGAELASFYTIVLSVPVVAVLPILVAIRASKAS